MYASAGLDARRPRFDPSAEQREKLAASFFEAAENGDFEALEAMLADDVALHGDGGGVAPAIRHPVFGRAKVGQLRRCAAMAVSAGQLDYEWDHLLGKLSRRNRTLYRQWRTIRSPECHPSFVVRTGGVEPWERA